MLDYSWFDEQRNNEMIIDLMVRDAHRRIKEHAAANRGIRFSRKAIFFTVKK